MTFTTTTLRKLRALGLDDATFDAVLEIFEDAQQSKPKKKGGADDRAARGTRLPEDWRLPPELQKYALDIGLKPREVQIEERKFRDYWIQQPGQKGIKITWAGTWRNWCLSMLERAGRAPILPESGPNGSGGVSEGPETFTDATWAAIAKRFKATGQWNSTSWGPEPGRMDCQMPETFL